MVIAIEKSLLILALVRRICITISSSIRADEALLLKSRFHDSFYDILIMTLAENLRYSVVFLLYALPPVFPQIKMNLISDDSRSISQIDVSLLLSTQKWLLHFSHNLHVSLIICLCQCFSRSLSLSLSLSASLFLCISLSLSLFISFSLSQSLSRPPFSYLIFQIYLSFLSLTGIFDLYDFFFPIPFLGCLEQDTRWMWSSFSRCDAYAVESERLKQKLRSLRSPFV